MALARVIPACASNPELRSYACLPCSDAMTIGSLIAWRLKARQSAA